MFFNTSTMRDIIVPSAQLAASVNVPVPGCTPQAPAPPAKPAATTALPAKPAATTSPPAKPAATTAPPAKPAAATAQRASVQGGAAGAGAQAGAARTRMQDFFASGAAAAGSGATGTGVVRAQSGRRLLRKLLAIRF